MTNLLTLEASSETCSVTLLTSEINQTIESQQVRSHSQLLLPFVDQLLDLSNLCLSDIDFIACSRGPGSFTGLRICFSVAQGMAFGLNIPMVMVCSLESMALMTYEKDALVGDGSRVTIATMDARMDQVYWAAFLHINTPQGIKLETLVAPCLQFISEAREEMERFIHSNPSFQISVVGNGLSLVKQAGLSLDGVVSDPQVMPSSSASSRLALTKWEQGMSVSAEDAELVYLRDTVSWKKRTRIRAQ